MNAGKMKIGRDGKHNATTMKDQSAACMDSVSGSLNDEVGKSSMFFGDFRYSLRWPVWPSTNALSFV